MLTHAEEFFGSARIKEQVTRLKTELVNAQGKLDGIKPPAAGRVEKYKATIDRLNTIRGRNLFYPYLGSGLGNGPYVELLDGSVKIDLINGIGIHLFGHGHPQLVETAIGAALQDVVMQGNLQPNQEYDLLLQQLVQAAGRKSRLRRGWIGTCGTIVNENALKIIRQKNTPARKIMAFHNCFAGRSTLMAEITDNPEYRQGLPVYNEVLYIPFFDPRDPHSGKKSLEAMKHHIDENPKNICGFMFELVQGEGGFNHAPPEFFKPLFELCRQHHIAIWADEIQTFSRTGELFAFEKLGLGEYIDIVTLAKTAQCGAALYTEEYNPKPGLIAGTYTASTVSLAVGHTVLKMLLDEKEKFFGPDGRIQKIHDEFTTMLGDLQKTTCREYVKDFGGLGLMVALTPYDGSKERVMKLLQVLFNNGLIAFSCGHGPYKLRFLLPLVLSSQHIQEIRGVLERSLKETAEGR